ncbi:hypothetical protein Q2490_17065 [Myroides odoratimimus]|uniref:hypothetical protein n=1 Tax=Myroides odoratimimus TaxID=76832 RepID=UPI0026DEF398|nr:hypothetical protein [Myroides odoratimimus]MDO5858990.1 hypothetical protein [Myroides odoratimimus]
MKQNIKNQIKELILKSNDIDEKTKLIMLNSLDDPQDKSTSPLLKSFLGSFLGKGAYDIIKHFLD